MKISVIHPTVRPVAALAMLQRWRDLAHDWSRVEYIVCGDTHMADSFAHAFELQGARVELLPPLPGYVYKLNHAARVSTGDILVEAHDDLVPPQDWDTLIAHAIATERINRPSGLIVLRVRHGGHRENELCVPMILTRPYYERMGFVTHPEIVHVYADDYFTWRATIDGVLHEAPDIAFSHDHPFHGRGEIDAHYQAMNTPQAYEEGEATFTRLKTIPPTDWATETLQIHVAVGNRFTLAKECLRNLHERTPASAAIEIHVWLDGPGDPRELVRGLNACPAVIWHQSLKWGIEKQRVAHLSHFLNSARRHPNSGLDWLYFTDADTVHAHGWFETLRRLHREVNGLACGYRTAAHAHNVTGDYGTHLLQSYVPGVSMLMTRGQAELVAQKLGDKDEMHDTKGFGGFDWAIPEILGHHCVVPACSLVDHVGAGGMHHGDPDSRGDRATNPIHDLDHLVTQLWPLAKLP